MLLKGDFLDQAVKWKGDKSNQFIDQLLKEWKLVVEAGQDLYEGSRTNQKALENLLTKWAMTNVVPVTLSIAMKISMNHVW